MTSISSTTTTSSFTRSMDTLVGEFEALQTSETREMKASVPLEVKQEKQTPSASLSAPTTVSKTVGTANRMLIIKNVHQDDIHGMIPVGANTFVTGSKDGALKLWNTAGKLVCEVWSPKTINYTGWITALAPFGSNHWMSGTRDGYIDLWQNNGEHSKNLSGYVAPTPGIKCKARNVERINCLAQDVTVGQYYVGVPTRFSMYQIDQPESIDQCKTSQNDWVYCIRPLADRKVMVVTGPNLDIFTHNPKSHNWVKEGLVGEELIAGKRATRSAQKQPRPFISDVVFLDGKTNLCALAVFGGAVIVFDIPTKTPMRIYKEHEKRVWQVVNIRPDIFASSSDDRTIKIWDARLAQSVRTIGDHIGRVSTLLRMSDTLLISGSCPDDLKSARERARLEFWDIRML